MYKRDILSLRHVRLRDSTKEQYFPQRNIALVSFKACLRTAVSGTSKSFLEGFFHTRYGVRGGVWWWISQVVFFAQSARPSRVVLVEAMVDIGGGGGGLYFLNPSQVIVRDGFRYNRRCSLLRTYRAGCECTNVRLGQKTNTSSIANLFSELASKRPMTEALSVEVHSPYPFLTRVLSITPFPAVLCAWCSGRNIRSL